MNERERRHLFLLAGQPLPTPTCSSQAYASSALQQVIADLGPNPAYVLGQRWDYNDSTFCEHRRRASFRSSWQP